MKNFIDIGTRIDLDDLIESRMLIQANSGGGKSGVSRVMMEECFNKIPFIVLDKKGEYFTLKELHSDIIVIGGPNGDIALSMQAAPLLARHIVSNRLTVVIDMISMESDDQRAIFIRDFLRGMMNLPQDMWHQYLVFIEEAHQFCGQQDKMPSGKYVRNLMSEGRKMGFAGILITQRIAKLHKDAAAECNNKFIGRTFLDVDMKRSADEMGLIGQDRNKLRELKPRHFWAFGTSIEPHYVHEVKIKEARTSFPKAGTKIDKKPTKPTDRIKQALAKLNELPQEAQRELKTIKDLQAEVSRLNNELKNKRKTGYSVDTVPDKVHSAAIKELDKVADERNRLRTDFSKMEEAAMMYKKLYGSAVKALDNVINIATKAMGGEKLTGLHKIELPQEPMHISRAIGNKNTLSGIERTQNGIKVTKANDQTGLGKCAREVIRFLASYPQRSFSKAQIGIATGYSPGSGGFNNALSELNCRQLILRDGKIKVNSDELYEIEQILGSLEPQEYNIETYKENLGKCEREIYEVLLQNPHDKFSKQTLAQRTETTYSPDSGGFNNALSRLNTLELIERSNGVIRLNPELIELM